MSLSDPPDEVPFVRVVILNFDGGQMTLDCVDSVLASDWPSERLEVVVVDNGSLDHVVERLRADDRYRSVMVLEPLENLGFAGGCNLGMAHPGEFDYVALINNDATVEPHVLRTLVAAAEERPRAGAVGPKILFADRFHVVDISASPATSITRRETRALGVRVSGVRFNGERVDQRLAFDEGFYGVEPATEGEEIARWCGPRGSLRIVSNGSPGDRVAVRLSSPEPRAVTLRSSVDQRTVEVGAEPVWVELCVPPEPVDVVNNVGSSLFADGLAGDRGFLEVDQGQFEEPAEVFAWCGGAVLLRRAYLDDVGLFDPAFFLYYEDTDLSWRGRLRGWSYWYVPGAVVRHRHGASTGIGSPLFSYYTERNRLLMLARNAPAPMALRAGLGELRRLIMSFVRSIVLRPLTARMPDRREFGHRWRVFRGYLSCLPAVLADRRRHAPRVDRRSILRWQTVKAGS